MKGSYQVSLLPIYTAILLIAMSLHAAPGLAVDAPGCRGFPAGLKQVCLRWNQIFYEGQTELYVPFYAWHNRFTYPAFKLNRYNELALGGGLGKSFYDEDGDWHGLYAMAFQDSHSRIEPVAGYAFLKMWSLNTALRVGGGYTVLVTGRADIFGGIPFPGILPWVSINYQRFAIGGTYIPGSSGAGNVLFLAAKVLL